MTTRGSRRKRLERAPWLTPLTSVALGAAMLAALWSGGHPGEGLAALGVMVLVALGLALGGRSDTVRALRGDGRDERFAMIDMRATAAAGLAVILALIVAYLVAVASGRSGQPYEWLCAVAGFAYIAAVLVLRRRH